MNDYYFALLNSTAVDYEAFIFLALCGVLFWSTFCRLNKLNKSAMLRVRLAYYALGVLIVLSMFDVVVWSHDPSWIECGLVASIAFVQIVTSIAWRESYPRPFSTKPTPLDEAEKETSHEATSTSPR